MDPIRAANPSPDTLTWACGRLAPTSAAFATLPIATAFNWDESLAPVEEGAWYLVVFRSIRRADADEALLTALDDRAHAEAEASPAFVHYFKGQVNSQRECLSFCLWRDEVQARQAASRPLHAEAASHVRALYETYRLERYHVRKEAGSLSFEPVGHHRAAEASLTPPARM
jgi:hypothetical protein